MAFLRPAQIVIRDARGTSEDLARGEVAYLAMLDAYSKFMPRIDVALLSTKKYEASWSEGAKERILVAELQGMIVGVADVMRLDDGWFLIEPMHVRPGYQHQGIGTLLFEKCEETAALNWAPGLRVYSLRDNENANPLLSQDEVRASRCGRVAQGGLEPIHGFSLREEASRCVIRGECHLRPPSSPSHRSHQHLS